MFHPETPSRVLRRISDLNQLSLPDLPDLPAELPSFSETTDADSTVAHSPVKGHDTPAPTRSDAERENRAPLSVEGLETPYTSTPATSSLLYARSDATVVPLSAQSRAANDTTATLRWTARPTTAAPSSELSYDDHPESAADSEMEEDEGDGTGFQDEMVVLSSGSGGEEDDAPDHEMKHAPVASLDLSALPQVQPIDETTAASEEESTRESRSQDYRSAQEEEDAPPIVKVSFSARPIGGPEADACDLQKSSAADVFAAENRLLPDSLSPLRDRDPSVELGRHASPQTSPHASLSRFEADATPSRAFSKSPSPHYATPRLDSPLASIAHETALSTPRVDQSAAQRRAAHVLTTLRSTAKPRLARGTPHPVRTAQKPALVRTLDDEEDRQSVSSIASEPSSNDLTTFHKGNTSLPSGGAAAAEIGPGGSRFDGAKLNSFLHALNTQLTDENQSLVQTLQKTSREKELLQAEARRLEDTIREMSVTHGAGGLSLDASSRVDRADYDDLKAELEATATERNALRSELAKLDGAFPSAAGARDEADLAAEVEEKELELERVRKQMEDQEAEFADKMEELERELCKVMEEQEAKVDQARREAEEQRREDEEARQADREKLLRLETECERLRQRSGDDSSDAGDADLSTTRAKLSEAEALVEALRDDVTTRDDELIKMQEELDTAEERIAELEAQVQAGSVSNSPGSDVLRQQLAQKNEEIKQLEDALDDSAQQLVDNETLLAEKDVALASAKADFTAEQEKRITLESRLSQLSVPKAKSPLANEVYNGADEDQITALEDELEAARREAGDLRRKLAEAEERQRLADIRDLEVQKLEADKANLEDRVKSLRQQAASPFSPSKTPDISWGLRPLPAVFTPRTPGQIFGNVSVLSPYIYRRARSLTRMTCSALHLESRRCGERNDLAFARADPRARTSSRAPPSPARRGQHRHRQQARKAGGRWDEHRQSGPSAGRRPRAHCRPRRRARTTRWKRGLT